MKDHFNKILSFVKEHRLCDIDPNLALVFFPIDEKEKKIHSGVNYYRRGSYVLKEKTIYLGVSDNFHHAFNSLCHELIHAEQHYTNRLGIEKYYNRDWFTWNGKKKIRVVDVINLELHEYMDLPWEREAYENESKLAKRICHGFNEKGNRQYASVLQELYRVSKDIK